MMSRNFSAKVEEQAEARAAGRCEKCGGQLKPGKYEFDHKDAHGLGGNSSLENCQVLCIRCHLEKSLEEDNPKMRAADRKAKIKKQLPVAAGVSEIARRYGVEQ